jgi:hypothetical protein
MSSDGGVTDERQPFTQLPGRRGPERTGRRGLAGQAERLNGSLRVSGPAAFPRTVTAGWLEVLKTYSAQAAKSFHFDVAQALDRSVIGRVEWLSALRIRSSGIRSVSLNAEPVLNMVVVALWTVGVFASLYAGYLEPELRVTASTLSLKLPFQRERCQRCPGGSVFAVIVVFRSFAKVAGVSACETTAVVAMLAADRLALRPRPRRPVQPPTRCWWI